MRGRYLQVLAVLTVLAVAGQPNLSASSQPGPAPPNTTITFELYRDYMVVVQASAGPLKGLNFLLDTGATPSVLDPRLAQRLHLANTGTTPIPVLSGSVQGATATLPSLQLGPIHQEDLHVLVEDLSFIQQWLPFQLDGIVGLDVLSQSPFVIDYTAREIHFGPIPPMPVSIPLQMKQGLPMLDAIVNDAPMQLLLDTGAPSLILFDRTSAPAQGLPVSIAQPSHSGIGSFDRKLERQINLKLGDAEFHHEPAFLVRNTRDSGHDFDGLISPAALGIVKVAIDLRCGTLAFAQHP
jgi:hypothetical protein